MVNGGPRMNVGVWEARAYPLRSSPGRASRADHGWRDFWTSFRSAGGSLSLACSGCSAAPSLPRRDVAAAGRPSLPSSRPNTNVAPPPTKCNTDGPARNLP
jgi:hypothetical protein